jgi:DNA polymerase-1
MQVVDTGEGPAYVVQTRSDAAALWDWLAPYRARGDYLGWDGETNAVQNTFHRDFRLRTAQMSDGQSSWVILAEAEDFGTRMLDVVRECTRAHPRWIAHYAENDIRFAHCGVPGSVNVHSIDPHFSCTHPLMAWFEPRIVTSRKPGIHPGIPLNAGLKQATVRILGTDVLKEAEAALLVRFREIAPRVDTVTPSGKPSSRAMTTKAAKQWGFGHIDVREPVFLVYAALDAMLELRMFHHMAAEINRRGLWPNVAASMRRQWHLDLMTMRGMLTDEPYARWLLAHFQQIVTDHSALLASYGVGESGMGPSVGEAFERLDVRSTRETPGGAPSWDKVMIDSVIENEHLALTENHKRAVELAKAIKTVRQATKFIPAYILPMIRAHVPGSDGRIHCRMREIGAITSRQSAQDPAVQQMPKRTSTLIRAGFIAPDGWVIVSCDLKQGEPRTMAAKSGDELLQADIEAGDINSTLAALTYGDKFINDPKVYKDASTPSYQYRDRGKRGFLSEWYGVGLRKLSSSLILGVPTAEAKSIRDRWHARYVKLSAYGDKLNQQKAVVLDNGWIVPLWDRYDFRGGKLVCTDKPSRKGLNADTQGNQKVIISIAHDRLIDWGWSWSLMMMVHDEIVGCVPEHMAEQYRAVLEAAMTMDYCGFPIRCDPTIEGRSWMRQTEFNTQMAIELAESVDA